MTMTEQITLYGDEIDWFPEVKRDIAQDRNGVEPPNPEAVQKLMEKSDFS